MFNSKSDENQSTFFDSVKDQNGSKAYENNSKHFTGNHATKITNCSCTDLEDVFDMVEEYFYVDVPIFAKEITSSEYYAHNVPIFAEDISRRVITCPATQ